MLEPCVIDHITSYSGSLIKFGTWSGSSKWGICWESPGVSLPVAPHIDRTNHLTLWLLLPLLFLSPTSLLPFWKYFIPFSYIFLFLCLVFPWPRFYSAKAMLWNGPQKAQPGSASAQRLTGFFISMWQSGEDKNSRTSVCTSWATVRKPLSQDYKDRKLRDNVKP